MAKRIEAIVKPAMLVWARESARMDIETAARKVPVSPDRLDLWERGEARPTINQLRKLGNAYKRPIAVFYLPEPPSKFQAMDDFRRLPEGVMLQESFALVFEIRNARNRRDLAIELVRAIGEELPDFPLAASISDDPERLAGEIREFLGVDVIDQINWQHGYKSFNNWRTALENAGVLVFQASDVEVDEIRGFSISDVPLPVIVVNIKDSVNGRIFTLFHELAHIMLREGGMCDLHEDDRYEAFCNRVAAATLMPRNRILQDQVVQSKTAVSEWSDTEIKYLANRYSVSEEAALRRMLSLGRTTSAFYAAKREQYQEEYLTYSSNRKGKGGSVPPFRKAISRVGPAFAKLVINNYYQDYITASDVSEFLEVKLKHLPKIETAVFRTS